MNAKCEFFGLVARISTLNFSAKGDAACVSAQPQCRNGTVRQNVLGSYSEENSRKNAEQEQQELGFPCGFLPLVCDGGGLSVIASDSHFRGAGERLSGSKDCPRSGHRKAAAVGWRCVRQGRKLPPQHRAEGPPSRAHHQGGLSVLDRCVDAALAAGSRR